MHTWNLRGRTVAEKQCVRKGDFVMVILLKICECLLEIISLLIKLVMIKTYRSVENI